MRGLTGTLTNTSGAWQIGGYTLGDFLAQHFESGQRVTIYIEPWVKTSWATVTTETYYGECSICRQHHMLGVEGSCGKG
jgi:hypothetical protein